MHEFAALKTHLPGMQAVKACSNRQFARHSHDQYGIGVVLHGAQTSWSDRGMVEAVAGDMILVNPGEVHDGLPVGGAARHWVMLYFDPPVIDACMADLADHRGKSLSALPPVLTDPVAASGFATLFASLTNPLGGAGVHPHELMLALAARLSGQMVEPLIYCMPEAIGAAKRRMDEQPADPHRLDDLAALANCSSFQFLRSFHVATGLTPHAYLMQARLALARRLIARQMPLAEAALSSGFADQSHMTRLFRRNFGMSPGNYALASR